MDNFTINLNKQEYLNLIEFMSRVNMQGQEAKAYILLMQKIESAKEIKKENIDQK